MKTYRNSMDKEDRAFIQAARVVLGQDFKRVMGEAAKAFNQSNPFAAAKRNANKVILNAMKDKGVTNWRQVVENK